MKTRLGISVGLLGAAIYFAGLFGGYVAVILLAGYVLLFEQDQWLKRTAVKAFALMVAFAFVLTVIGLIPDILGWIGSLVSVFDGNFNYEIVTKIITVITRAIDIIRTVLFLLLGVSAFSQSSITLPLIDKTIDKYM